jgi:hypothetical protein
MKKLLALALFSTSLAAQTKSKPIDVTVSQINDRRTSGSFSQLVITLELPSVKSADVAAARVLVSNAVDDSGHTLVDAEAGEPELQANSRAMYGGESGPSPATVSVTLKNPDRKSVAVKQVSGEIELYMPSKDPNSVAEFAKFTSLSGKPLAHRALKANAVDVAALNATQLAAEKKRMGDAKREELKAAGYDEESMKDVITGYLDSLWSLDEGDVLLRVKDPNKRIQEISYVDGKGETKRASLRDDNGLFVLSTWGEKPQADWKLRVSMKTAKNLVRYPFALANVALP